MSKWIQPVTLTGQHVQLEPLERRHHDELAAAAADGELWKLWYTSVPTPDNTATYIDAALAMRDNLGALPFVARVMRDGQPAEVVGTTRIFNVDAVVRRFEIGHTWYAARVQRTALNTEAKQLLLTHGFETLGAIAVELRTHFMNHASRAAIARLGAKQDGILRNHGVMADGSYRDTVVFSIIESEWPAVRRNLAFKLSRRTEKSC